MPKVQSEDKQRDADKWHREARGPARRLRGGRGGRREPTPRLGAEQQLSQPGLHEHRQGLLRSAEHLRADFQSRKNATRKMPVLQKSQKQTGWLRPHPQEATS